MRKFKIYGQRTSQESVREKEHRDLARTVAAEGMVLLQNDGVLPLAGRTIALYGNGARMTIRGGSGSGDMRERYSVNIEQGLINAGFTFPNNKWLDRFDKQYEKEKEDFRLSVEAKIKGYGPIRTMQMFDIIHEQRLAYPIGDEIRDDEWADTDTAIYVVARQAGEGGDRRMEKGDFLLADAEYTNIAECAKRYKNFLLVINSGSIIDLSFLDSIDNIGAVLFFVQGGTEGGNAFADLVTGKVSPSGKLTDTWGMRYADYPSAETFSYLNGELEEENYYEGIYAGYRWFDAMDIAPRFPFGFGLSYTQFEHSVKAVSVSDGKVQLSVSVKNIGDTYSGKEVLQCYLAKPQGRLSHEKYSLVAFAKTPLITMGESAEVSLQFDLSDHGTFDASLSAFILGKGEYGVFVGNSSRDILPCAVLTVDKEIIVEQVEHICLKKQSFVDMQLEIPAFAYEKTITRYPIGKIEKQTHDYRISDSGVSQKIRALAESLTDDELIRLCVGAGYGGKNYNRTPGVAGRTTGSLLKKGIPDINMSDGPAGLNVLQKIVYLKSGSTRYVDELPADWQWGWVKKIAPFVMAKKGKGTCVYQYMTAFPSETLQAQTWNLPLIEQVGKAVGKEMKEIGVTLWLAPGMNIHRNPLCGRNFEYYSEDPVITGKMAAAITSGVQNEGGVGVTIKHFCCNNQEDNRNRVSSNMSERTLREMYLKGFRIAVEESKPWAIMTSYNRVNGVYTPNSHDLCTKVLRQEWGFDGIVMSDWNATDQASHGEAIEVGNDLIMPGNKRVRKALQQSLKAGGLTRKALVRSAARILKIIFDSAVVRDDAYFGL